MASIKEEILTNQTDELLVDNTQSRDDEESFILSSQLASGRSAAIAVNSPKCTTQDAYMLPTVVDDSEAPRTIINETIMNSILDGSIAVVENDSPAKVQCDDLFETEPYLMDESSLVQATPLHQGRPMVPETPAMVNEDSDDDSFIKTPHLTMARLVTQSQRPRPAVGTTSQLADTQPVLTSTVAVAEELVNGQDHHVDDLLAPAIVDVSTDSNIDEFKDDTVKEKDVTSVNGSIPEVLVATESKIEKQASFEDQKLEDENQVVEHQVGEDNQVIYMQKSTSSQSDRTLSVEKLQRTLSPAFESDAERATEPAPTPQGEEDLLVVDENGERIAASVESDVEIYTVTFQIKSRIQYDKASKQILQQKFLDVKAQVETIPDTSSEITDKSKRESLSSAGSVYSDKQDLPYKLKSRVSLSSNQTSSTSTVEENASEQTNGSCISLDDKIANACQNALKRHFQLESNRLKRTPYNRLSRASKTLFEKIQNESFDGSSREQSVDEKLQPDVKLLLAEIETPLIAADNLDEEADTVPPLPLVKSTPKRTRRPPRSKVRGKPSAVKSKKLSESEKPIELGIPLEAPVISHDVTETTVTEEPERASPHSTVEDEPVTEKKRDESPKKVTEKTPPKKAIISDKKKSKPVKKASSNTKKKVPSTFSPEKTTQNDQDSSTLTNSTVEGEPVSKKKRDESPKKAVEKSPPKKMIIPEKKKTKPVKQASSNTKKKAPSIFSPEKTTENDQDSSTLTEPDKKTTAAKPRKRPAKTDAVIAEDLATPGPSGVKMPRVTSLKKLVPTENSDVSTSSATEETSGGSVTKRGRGRKKAIETPNTPAVRRPRRSNTPPLSAELQPGAAVFARWSDNFFYRGSITAAAGNKWEVCFEDGNTKVIASHFVVSLSLLREGHTVMVKTNDTYFPAMIISLRDRSEYLVEVAGKEKIVKADELGLTADQAKTVLEDKPALFGTPSTQSSRASIDPDNIVSERRRGQSLNLSIEPLGSVKRKRKRSPVQYELTLGLETDETVTEASQQDLPSAKKTPKSRKNLVKNEEMEKKLGPIPAKPIFDGMGFLLCEVKAKVQRPNKRMMTSTTDSDVSMSESEDVSAYDKYEKFPFQADWLKKQIVAGGGVLYERFEDVPMGKYSQTRLVTNRPNRSAKFLLCLVNDIDIVLHLHVVEACRGQELKSMKLHHAGWSLSTKRWVDRSAQVQKTFSGKQICVNIKCDNADDEKRINAFWNIVLKKAGANVVEQVDYADVIVTDTSLPDDIREVLSALGDSAPSLVSPNWVIESIIHGYPVEQASHASFLHDFNGPDSSS